MGLQGYKAIPRLLEQAGLHTVFAMLGGSNAPWVADGVAQGSLRLVRTRHEETAVHAASGFARTTRSIALCSVTRGPGFTNAVNALTVATRGHVPILLITGESPPTRAKTPQIVDQRAVAAAIGAGFHHVAEAGDLEPMFWEAIRAVNWNGSPQILSVGDGVLDSDVDVGEPPTRASLRPGDEPDPNAVEMALDTLFSARHPLILVGMGALLADCRSELEELAVLVGADVATTLMMNRYFSGYSHDLGICGTWSPPVVADRLADVDVVLSVGASLNFFTLGAGSFFSASRVIQCEIDPDQPFKASSEELALLGDASVSVRRLVERARARAAEARERSPIPTRAEMIESILSIDLDHDPGRGLDPREVYRRMDQRLPEDRIVVSDHGRFQGSLMSIVDARDGASFVVPISYSSIGTGLGHAIGAAAAHPNRPVVLFAGDGGFMMSSHDLDAVRINELSMTIVILDDEQYASDAKFLRPLGLPFDTIRQSLPDIAKLAEAFGGRGMVITSLDELDRIDFKEPGLTILDIRIDPQVTGTPF